MQTILNFKLESTNEKLTPRTGVTILGEYLKSMNFESLCNDNLPKAKRNNGYSAFEFIYPYILMLHRGISKNHESYTKSAKSKTNGVKNM